jgi:photosystem II stability/assembly factor-like uncharacterized protein/DNA-binding CsgD family transcriptional regulator
MGQRGRPRSPNVLTPREQDVLALIRDGLTNEQISERLNIGFETAKSHVAEILSKLGVATREEAAAWHPEPERRWSFGRIALTLAGTAVFAAAVAGLALLAWGLSRSGGGQVVEATGTPTSAASVPSPSPATGLIEGPNVSVRAFWMADSRNGWMGGASRGCQVNGGACVGVIFHTSDGGQSWDEQYSGDVLVSGLAFDDRELGFAIGTTGTCDTITSACPSSVLRTTDGGLHWSQVTTTLDQLLHLAVSANDAWVLGRGCVSGQPSSACDWKLYTSSDGGSTWNSSNLPISGFATDTSRPTANDAWIVTSPTGPGNAQIIVTHDAGETWQHLSSPDAGFEQRIFFRSANDGWLVVAGQPAAGSQFKEVFSTTDGGQTWTHLAGALAPPSGNLQEAPGVGIPISGYLGPVVFTSDLDGWMASPRYGLFHTSDGGANWSLSLTDDNLSAVQFTDPQHGWAVSLISFWSTSDGGDTWQRTSPPDAANP